MMTRIPCHVLKRSHRILATIQIVRVIQLYEVITKVKKFLKGVLSRTDLGAMKIAYSGVGEHVHRGKRTISPMGSVTEYLSKVDEVDRAALARVYAIAQEIVPEADEGTSYAMAALIYRGEGLIATVRAKKFLSLYPYSGAVVAANRNVLADFKTTTGSVHYTAVHQLPELVVRRIVQARRAEIDLKAGEVIAAGRRGAS
jgi:uncharacterized protein YdhG (YjbR/CyaY superfamily)